MEKNIIFYLNLKEWRMSKFFGYILIFFSLCGILYVDKLEWFILSCGLIGIIFLNDTLELKEKIIGAVSFMALNFVFLFIIFATFYNLFLESRIIFGVVLSLIWGISLLYFIKFTKKLFH